MVAREETQAFPGVILKYHFSKAALGQSSTALVLEALWIQKQESSLGSQRVLGTLSSMRVDATTLGIDATAFGVHSFWAGGAAAAVNADVPDHLFK